MITTQDNPMEQMNSSYWQHRYDQVNENFKELQDHNEKLKQSLDFVTKTATVNRDKKALDNAMRSCAPSRMATCTSQHFVWELSFRF